MKLLTLVVPCFNSQNYLETCVDSLLAGGNDVEIIIVDDGSTDSTGAIADGYAEKYPSVVKVIRKPNGGHGSALNRGLEEARGLYFKVVDSDDWLDKSAFVKLLSVIREHVAVHTLPDYYITNFVYYHAQDGTSYTSEYTKKMPVGFVDWRKVKSFHFSHTLMMHALTYNTEKLRENYVQLPEHTFYVDNIYAFSPLVNLRTAYYLDVCLYYYFIGREDQSINVVNCVQRYSQQIKVMTMMCLSHTYAEICAAPRGLKKYLMHYLRAIMMNTLFFTCARCDKARKADLKKMWRDIKSHDKKLYRKVRYMNYPLAVAFLPWRLRGRIMTFGYNILKKRVKLGL